MKEKLTCKPITYSYVNKIKYFVKTNCCEGVFDNEIEYRRYVDQLSLMKVHFKVTIRTINLLYSNNALVCRSESNEYHEHWFDFKEDNI